MSQLEPSTGAPGTRKRPGTWIILGSAAVLLIVAAVLSRLPAPPGPPGAIQATAEPALRPPPPPPPPVTPRPEPQPLASTPPPAGVWRGFACTPWPAEPCRVRCRIDAEAGTTDCPSTLIALQRGAPGQLAARLDLRGMSSLELRATICDPQGMVLHVADSPTCNGYGGDSGSRSHDAELQLAGSALAVYAADTMRGQQIMSVPDVVPGQGCHDSALWLADGEVRVAAPCQTMRSEHSLRLNPPSDQEGPADAEWYLGLNQVYTGGRRGAGLKSLQLCVR